MSIPPTLTVSAWTGDAQANVSALDPVRATQWGLRGDFPDGADHAAPPKRVPAQQWQHQSHGWGLVLPEPVGGDWSDADKALAIDAPAAVQRLVLERLESGPAPVFRYDPDLGSFHLRRYFADGRGTSTPKVGQQFGLTGTNAVPLYLLIVADPEEVPWAVQFALNQRHHVGRLSFADEGGLNNYVSALLDDWSSVSPAAMSAKSESALVWCVDSAGDAMTREMRATIAHPVSEKLAQDTEIDVQHLVAGEATLANLHSALAQQPGLIVSTSHGQTSPLHDAAAMAAGIGLLVDQHGASVDSQALLQSWSPNGALWYAHACCSAGTNHDSLYLDLLTPQTPVHNIIAAVAALPSMVAPLPQALLGAPQPLRGFIGHVEPTFDWPLRDGRTNQALTNQLIDALYTNLFQPLPIALAFDEYYRGVGQLYAQWQDCKDRVNEGDTEAATDALRARLSACDRQSLVLLGDPAVALPPLASTANNE